MQPAPVVILFEPSDEPVALAISSTLDVLGARCWVEGLEVTGAPTRLQALASCRAIVVVRDEAGGAYGALDAGAISGMPVFVYERREGADERARLRTFCERVASVVRDSPAQSLASLGDAPLGRLAGRPLAVALVATLVVASLVAVGSLGWVGYRLAQDRSARVVSHPPAGVGLTATPNGAGWLLLFRFPSPPVEVQYELASSPGYRSTGAVPGSVDASGALLAKSYAMLGPDEVSGPTSVRVKYRLARGELQGPFELSFDPATAAVASARNTLDDLAPQWLSFREFDGRTLVYFTSLLVHKHALREIKVGLDEGALNQGVRFKPSSAPGLDSDDEMFRAIPPKTHSVSVQLVFRDGTSSTVRTFRVPPDATGVAPRPTPFVPDPPAPLHPAPPNPWPAVPRPIPTRPPVPPT